MNLTLSMIMKKYSVAECPMQYMEFIDNIKKEIGNTKMYKLKGVLNIGIDTELTNEILETASELYHNTVVDSQYKEKIEADYKTLNEIINTYKLQDDSINCCGCTSNDKNEKYIFYNDMDDNNKKAMDVWESSGIDAAIKHMMTNENGEPRSYSEMREMYG